MKTICIDTRFYGVGDTGIGRYVENLIKHLPSDPAIKIVLIDKTRFHPYSLWSQFEMFWRLLQIRPDLLHVPHDSPPLLWFGPTIVTIHDLTKLKSTGLDTTTLPPWLYYIKLLGYKILLYLSLHKSSRIIVPSNYVKTDLLKSFDLSPAKISVIYEGVDHG